MVVALSVGLVLGGGGWALTMRGAACDGPDEWISVTADPAIAPAALAAADRFNQARRAAGECSAVKVVSGDSGDVADAFHGRRGTPDVWIPDSSLWSDLAHRAEPGKAPSVASSPIVFALPRAAAGRHRAELARRSWGAFQPRGPERDADGASFRLRLPDPARSGTGMATLLALKASSGKGQDALNRFTARLRMAQTLPYGKGADAAFGDVDGGGGNGQGNGGSDGEGAAVLTISEQAVWQHNRSITGGVSPLTAVYPSAGAPYLDFPFVVATADGERKRVARRFLEELRSAPAAADLRRAGLREPGANGTAAGSVAGVEPPGAHGAGRAEPGLLPIVRPGAAAEILETWRRYRQGLNILVVVDPFGAGAPMPAGSGKPGSRLQAMLFALATGFTLPDDSAIGLWTLTGAEGRPYRPIQPIRDLGTRTSYGGNHRLVLQRALGGVRSMPGRGTGLYTTIRAAYDEVARNYGGNKLNIVLVLTPGGPRDHEGGEFDRTVEKLKAAFDPRRPVSVVAYGVGAEAAPTLRRLAAVTDGGTYRIDNPDMVMRLFQRSDQLRICDAPRCHN
ncbi:substrate-binding domain-containing protein [Actinomadura roseirufa]|uniref:substrate-binding domain-containing protein n=1 Tax=Actinomadura roseirufa TaxID=2094049 RepID=UPI0013F1797D|nr:substrate-binding domain-containing protein [Actinomadura roseirufa]